MRQSFSTGRLAAVEDHEVLTADDNVTMVRAMIDGLRIQSLLDPDRDVLPLMERLMRMLSTTRGA